VVRMARSETTAATAVDTYTASMMASPQ
jgi:hypothetical protein